MLVLCGISLKTAHYYKDFIQHVEFQTEEQAEVQRKTTPIGKTKHEVNNKGPLCAALMNTRGNRKAKCDFL